MIVENLDDYWTQYRAQAETYREFLAKPPPPAGDINDKGKGSSVVDADSKRRTETTRHLGSGPRL